MRACVRADAHTSTQRDTIAHRHRCANKHRHTQQHARAYGYIHGSPHRQRPTPALTPTPTEIPCFRLLTPENGITLPVMGKITFIWQPMPGAARYHLQITLPGGKLLAIDTSTTSITRYADTFLDSGVYTWQVLALNGNSQELCLTEPFTFQKPAPPTPDKGGNDDRRGSGENGSGNDDWDDNGFDGGG